jgi:queuine tRNA-ribosyltransferase
MTEETTLTETAAFSFSVHARDGAARTGAISMPRGEIRTPAFMPVGTAATVKAMYTDQVRALGADVVLGGPARSAWPSSAACTSS